MTKEEENALRARYRVAVQARGLDPKLVKANLKAVSQMTGRVLEGFVLDCEGAVKRRKQRVG